MKEWISNNFKKFIICLTGLIVPSAFWAFGVFADLRNVLANDKIQDVRIYEYKSAVDKTEGKFELILESLKRIEDREYQELKQARQLRQAYKP